jgi:hypothetical protein
MAKTRNVFPDVIHVKVEDTGDLTAYETLHEIVDDDGKLAFYGVYRLESVLRAKKIVEIQDENP